MQREPTEAYVYQPLPGNHKDYPRIYGVAGPGSEAMEGKTYTKEDAEHLVEMINWKRETKHA